MSLSNNQFSEIMSAIKGLNETTIAAREDSREALEGLRGLRTEFEAYKSTLQPKFPAISPKKIQPAGEAGRSSPGKNDGGNSPKKHGFSLKKRLDPAGHGYDWSTFLAHCRQVCIAHEVTSGTLKQWGATKIAKICQQICEDSRYSYIAQYPDHWPIRCIIAKFLQNRNHYLLRKSGNTRKRTVQKQGVVVARNNEAKSDSQDSLELSPLNVPPCSNTNPHASQPLEKAPSGKPYKLVPVKDFQFHSLTSSPLSSLSLSPRHTNKQRSTFLNLESSQEQDTINVNDDKTLVYVDNRGWLFSEAGKFLPVDYSTANPQKYELLDGSGKIHLNKWPKVFANYSQCFSDGITRKKNAVGHWEVGWVPGAHNPASIPVVEHDAGEDSLIILETPLPSQQICVIENAKSKPTAKKAPAKKTTRTRTRTTKAQPGSKTAGTKGPPRQAKTKGKKSTCTPID